MNRIDSNLSVGRFEADAWTTRDRAGSLAGERVRTKDAISLLEDAREEISMHHSEKVEAKEFTEREIGAAPRARLVRIEQIESYLDATRRFTDPRGLADIVKRMQAHSRPRDVAQQESRAPAHQFALLQLALHDASKRGLSIDVIERLQEALEDIEHWAGPEILAGLNSAQAAADFAPTMEGVENFQQVYADIVLGENNLAQTLLVVLQRLGGVRGNDFHRGLQALLHAMGADLSATRASTDPRRLQQLIQDVYHLEVAGSVLEGCAQLSEAIAKRFGIESLEPLGLMTELVELTNERWVAPARMRSLAEKFMLTGLGQRIALHTGTKSLLRQMPVQVFSDAETRQAVLESAQAALDDAVAEEEEKQGT